MMRPMAAAAVGALISGLAVYAVSTRAADNTIEELPALIQTVDGRYVQVPDARVVALPAATAPVGYAAVAPRAAAPVLVRQTTAPARVSRAEAPAPDRAVVREAETSPERSWGKTAMIVGGSAASGAGVGGLIGGKKGALVGAAIGGGAASIYEATRRR